MSIGDVLGPCVAGILRIDMVAKGREYKKAPGKRGLFKT
jgi:hypothetical protein